MSSMVSALKGVLNRVSDEPVPVVEGEISTELPVMDKDTGMCAIRAGAPKAPISPENLAIIGYENDYAQATNLEKLENNGERLFVFPQPTIKLPVEFSSYEELVTSVVGNVLKSSAIRSINASFFGDLLKLATPKGYELVSFGKHDFLVLKRSDRMVYIFEFLKKARDSLMENKEYSCDFVEVVGIGGVAAYSLVLTPKEVFDIVRSYPAYQISCVLHDDVAQMRLVMRVLA